MWTKFHLRSLYDEGIERLGISFGEDVALSTQILVRSGKVVSINTPILDYYVIPLRYLTIWEREHILISMFMCASLMTL